MICPNCGTQIPEGTSYCPLCGSDIIEKEETLSTQNNDIVMKKEDKNEVPSGKEKKGRCQKKQLIIVGGFLVVIVVVVVLGLSLKNHNTNVEPPTEQNNVESIKSAQKDNDATQTVLNHQELQSYLESYINTNGVNQSVSVYYDNLADGEEFSYNSQSMRAGQSGRIFVMEYIMDAILAGQMEQTEELMETLEKAAMGDEPASHRLVELITGDFAESLDLVSEYVQKKGYNQTIINRFNGDIGNHTSTMPNQTSVKDTGRSIRHIYDMAQSGDTFAKDLLKLLSSNASLKNGIAVGAYNTDGAIEISNLEARWTECENDVAIVTYGDQTIIISIMIAELTEDESEHDLAMQNIHEITEEICFQLFTFRE